MKKFITILILCIYAIPSLGLTVSLHYCGGKIASVSFGDVKKGCLCSGKPMKKGCCKDQKISLKNDNKQKQTDQFELQLSQLEWVTLPEKPVYAYSFFAYKEVDKIAFYGRPPPPLHKNPIFILNNVFRI